MKKILILVLVVAGFLFVPTPAQAATDVLPDLRTRRLGEFVIQQASNGEKRLRFTSQIANYGPGKFEVRGYRSTTTEANMKVRQRIYNTDGGRRVVEIPGTHMFWAGDGHSHWHLSKLQTFSIHPIAADGTVGASKGGGAKTGFCFFDNTVYNLSLPNAPQSPVYKGCGTQSSLAVVTGISVGWADKYGWQTAYQWIKINSLADGNYKVRVVTDPQNWFKETNEANNGTWTDIKISGNTVRVIKQPY